MSRYLALLRGINVGGKNLISMAALKAFFEGLGFEDVITYIQSGNVIFSSSGRPLTLVTRIESGLAKEFDYAASIVLRSKQQMRKVVLEAPDDFGKEPALYRYDVIYLKDPLAAADVISTVPVNPEVDQVHEGPGVLYFSRLIAKASQSKLSRLVSMSVYKKMTIRNWNTTVRLHEMLQSS